MKLKIMSLYCSVARLKRSVVKAYKHKQESKYLNKVLKQTPSHSPSIYY